MLLRSVSTPRTAANQTASSVRLLQVRQSLATLPSRLAVLCRGFQQSTPQCRRRGYVEDTPLVASTV